VRQRAEDELDVAERRIFGSHERNVAAAGTNGRAALIIRRCKGERQVRVPLDERAKLATCVAAGPENADWNSIHE
jgi:hypothetical protein